MACCCRCTQCMPVSHLLYKQAGAFNRKCQAGSSSLLLLVHRAFLPTACLGDLGDGIFFLSCNSCRNSCLNTLPWPPHTPFLSQSPLPLPAVLSSLFSTTPCSYFPLCPLLPLFHPSYKKLAWGATERVKPSRSHGWRSVGGLMHGKVPFWHAEL